jgi:hypothetical protein
MGGCVDFEQIDFIPARLSIGGSRYRIVQRPALWRKAEGVEGPVRFDDMEMDLVVEDRPPGEICNTLIHECLHICYREFHIKPKCGEERTVTALGYAINALYAQNPDLLMALASLQELADE